jgi:hypothetical protein
MLNNMPEVSVRMIYIGIAAVTVLLNVLSWSSTAFCDAYIAHIFPVWVNTYGRLTGLFPFSVGEWMLIAGMVLAAAAVVLLCPAIYLWCRSTYHKDKTQSREDIQDMHGSRHRWIGRYYRFCAWVLLFVCLIMTLNCSILYHGSSFSEKYFGKNSEMDLAADSEAYSASELLQVRNDVAASCNRLSAQMARDEKGYILYPGSVSEAGNEIDMADKAREVMGQLGTQYAQLDGYYPRPKPMFFSDFMCRQYMLGWYFPFSMEANYNQVAYVMNQPASMCHELAHLKGFIYEDEANFISYLACIESDDIYFQYSGYLSVLSYLERDLQKVEEQTPEAYREACETEAPVRLLDMVYQDDTFVTDEEWERIDDKAVLDSETVDEATNAFLETSLKTNGVADGMVSYSRVVELLLQYYRLK